MDAKTLLLIDDCEDDRYLIKRLIREHSPKWSIQEAETGEYGLQILHEVKIDAILLDYSLPGSDGLYTLPQIKQSHPFIPVVMLTGQGNEKVAVESIKKGASDYISKGGLTHYALIKAVNNAIESTQLQQKIEEQNKELSQFAHVLAHDLKQPANAIFKMGQLITTKFAKDIPQEALNKLHLLTESSMQMYQLIDALVSYTQLDLQSEHLIESTDVTSCVELALTNLAAEVNRSNAAVRFGSLPTISAIPCFIVQLFQILIENSLKYCEKKPDLTICHQSDETHWHFSIQDNGIGVPTEYREKAFDPLFRLHSAETYQGSGLGLATAKRIVNKHDGVIYFADCENEGSKLNFTIKKCL
ncbi:response regulator [Pseudoalteromonas luteoviolacea]|uniref:sensor histidine kinase n=1 Tax=Pseudoalteromonas luteoviolacea TaxID=43657 RepID=UPI001B370D62|nr:hybrid sensor histidine kinase/response regulator [Pseudoalteromonas luteoviolacea]MBQ4811167.1 response regulator [Pseudoalteromonas luteoviolacea]